MFLCSLSQLFCRAPLPLLLCFSLFRARRSILLDPPQLSFFLHLSPDGMHRPLLLLRLLWPCHTRRLLLILPQWTLSALVPFLSTFEASYSFHPYAPHYSFLYATLHHSALQNFKFILGHFCPFPFLFFVPAISGQVPEPFAAPAELSLSPFQFYPQFGEGAFLFEQVAQ